MLIEKLDRNQWHLNEALQHIAVQILLTSPVPTDPVLEPVGAAHPVGAPWLRPKDPAVLAQEQAEREIQIALRDGDLHAKGRLSTTQCQPWNTSLDGWDLHSGHHSTITPEQWRAGRAGIRQGTLTMAEGQFIDIRVPRFMVLAIWPVVQPRQPGPDGDLASGERYRTPYMDLLDRAIAENRIHARDQGKKELLSDWFRAQTIEGEPVSQNLADAMATLIRLPSSQRGGAKRGW